MAFNFISIFGNFIQIKSEIFYHLQYNIKSIGYQNPNLDEIVLKCEYTQT